MRCPRVSCVAREPRLQRGLGRTQRDQDPLIWEDSLGRPLGDFIFSLIGLKRTLSTNIFSEALKGQPVP